MQEILSSYLTRNTVLDPNLQPIYALSEQQQQQIINQLANLLISTIQQLDCEANGELAKQIAAHASRILLDYDEDVAEIIASATQSKCSLYQSYT